MEGDFGINTLSSESLIYVIIDSTQQTKNIIIILVSLLHTSLHNVLSCVNFLTIVPGTRASKSSFCPETRGRKGAETKHFASHLLLINLHTWVYAASVHWLPRSRAIRFENSAKYWYMVGIGPLLYYIGLSLLFGHIYYCTTCRVVGFANLVLLHM